MMPLFFALYGKRPSEYYFNYLLPLIFLAILLFFSQAYQRLLPKLVVIGFGLLVMVNLALTSLGGLKPNLHSLFYKNKLAWFMSEISICRQPINVSFSVPLGQDTGYRYLFDYYKISLDTQDQEPLWQVVIPPKQNMYTFGKIGLIIPDQWRNNYWLN